MRSYTTYLCSAGIEVMEKNMANGLENAPDRIDYCTLVGKVRSPFPADRS